MSLITLPFALLLFAMVPVAFGSDPSLVNAIEKREWSLAGKLLTEPEQLTIKQPDGMTALHWAE
jgi:hypothetical protein